MNRVLKIAIAAAAAVAVVVAGISFLPRDRAGVGGPGAVSPSPVISPSPEPSPSPRAVSMKVAGSDSSGSVVQLTAELPEGWTGDDFVANAGVGAPDGIAFFLSVVDNTFSDPCAHVQRSPKIGSTVEAWTAALGEIPNLTATAPVQTTLAGRQATYIELTIPASLPCQPDQFYLWQDSPDGDWWALAPNEVIRVWILDVGGRPVAIAARSYPGTSDAKKAELQGILDSIVFDASSTQPSATPAAS
jgi:hypothetical protein